METLRADGVAFMIHRALNLVDERLVDHGVRVAYLVDAMLETAKEQDRKIRQDMRILSMLHDIGAYRTDEVDRLVQFETEDIWEHSVYGYLFLREFTPLQELSQVILYHHMRYDSFRDEPEAIRHYSQLLHVADRADVFFLAAADTPKEKLWEHFEDRKGSAFSPEAVELFWEAERRRSLLDKLRCPICLEEVMDSSDLSPEDARTYLEMLVHSIDFRSHHTVSHTVNTMQISRQLALRLGLGQEETEQVYYGAMIHDLGKIGIPLEILEKPGRLTPEEMTQMRTHVDLTEEVIQGCVEDTVARIALRHHEKLDGTGYPRGLGAEELTKQERIVAVADIVSALCGSRSYKEEYPKEKVILILEDMRKNGRLDEQVVLEMEQEYDDILAQVKTHSTPVMQAYARIQAENVPLLEKMKAR